MHRTSFSQRHQGLSAEEVEQWRLASYLHHFSPLWHRCQHLDKSNFIPGDKCQCLNFPTSQKESGERGGDAQKFRYKPLAPKATWAKTDPSTKGLL